MADAFQKPQQPEEAQIQPVAGTSLAVQWLRLPASKTDCMGSIPGQGTKVLCGAWCQDIKTNKQNGGGRLWQEIFKRTRSTYSPVLSLHTRQL